MSFFKLITKHNDNIYNREKTTKTKLKKITILTCIKPHRALRVKLPNHLIFQL